MAIPGPCPTSAPTSTSNRPACATMTVLMRVALLALMILLAAPAHAASRTTGVATTGAGVDQAELTAHLRTLLEARDFTFSANALSADALNTIANCFVLDDVECARGVFEARGTTDT